MTSSAFSRTSAGCHFAWRATGLQCVYSSQECTHSHVVIVSSRADVDSLSISIWRLGKLWPNSKYWSLATLILRCPENQWGPYFRQSECVPTDELQNLGLKKPTAGAYRRLLTWNRFDAGSNCRSAAALFWARSACRSSRSLRNKCARDRRSAL